MTIKQLATEVAKKEGKKSQARIGEVREILSIISDLLYEPPVPNAEIFSTLYANGKRRAKRGKK